MRGKVVWKANLGGGHFNLPKECKEVDRGSVWNIEERTIFQLFCLVVVLGEKLSNN